MKSNILRAFKACLLRRKISKSPSCNTIASFYAGPEHLRDLDDSTHDSVAPSNIPTFIISSPSQCEAMLTAASVVEIEVRADDDGDYEGHPNRDTISTLSSITCVQSFAESEDVFSVAEDCRVYAHSDVPPIVAYCSDTALTPSSITSEESLGKSENVFSCAEDVFEDVPSNAISIPNPTYQSHMGTYNEITPIIKHPTIEVASAIPKRLSPLLELKNEEFVTRRAELKLVDDIDAEPNYHIDWLTDDALDEAQNRSRRIKRTARIRNLDLVKVVPLKAHEHPAPQGHCKASALKGQGHSSPLKSSWNAEDEEQALWGERLERSLEDLQYLVNRFSNWI